LKAGIGTFIPTGNFQSIGRHSSPSVGRLHGGEGVPVHWENKYNGIILASRYLVCCVELFLASSSYYYYFNIIKIKKMLIFYWSSYQQQ
jgi:hypothetical protein